MTVGVRHDDLRRQNRAMVIAAVRRAGQPSRTELVAATGLSHSTISTIAASLIEERILVEGGGSEAGSSRRGRPQVALALNPHAATVVAVALSLNSLSATLIDYAGGLIAREVSRPATLTMSGPELVGAVRAAVRRVLAPVRAGRRAGPLLRMTLGVQGIADSAARRLLWSPIAPHRDLALADALEAEFGVPVTVENDCNMIALALKAQSPQRYRDDFAAVLLSNGIGMGLVLRGALFHGSRSSGGEFGHMIHVPDGALCRCGRRGCIEAYAGNYAILRHARGQGEDAPPAADIDNATMTRLATAARAGPGRERDAFERAGAALGFGLGSLFALIDPAPVALVGHGATAFDIIEPAMRAALARTAGGHDVAVPGFTLEGDETPLILDGCASRALGFVDRGVFAAGPSATARAVARAGYASRMA